MWVQNIRVSAEDWSCLEGVFTVRRSQREARDESEKKLWQTADSLLSILAWTCNQWGARRLHMITFACFENQFRCRVLNFLHSSEKVKWAARGKNYNSLITREQNLIEVQTRILVAQVIIILIIDNSYKALFSNLSYAHCAVQTNNS